MLPCCCARSDGGEADSCKDCRTWEEDLYWNRFQSFYFCQILSSISEFHNQLINPKAAESLANRQEYSNIFDDCEIALAIESKVTDTSPSIRSESLPPSNVKRKKRQAKRVNPKTCQT